MSSWEIFVEAKLYCTHLETRTFWGFTLKVHFIEFLLYSEKSVINFFPVKIKGLILYWADHLSQGSGHLWRVFRVREQQLELQVYSQCAVDKMPWKLIYLALSTWPALKLFFFSVLADSLFQMWVLAALWTGPTKTASHMRLRLSCATPGTLDFYSLRHWSDQPAQRPCLQLKISLFICWRNVTESYF